MTYCISNNSAISQSPLFQIASSEESDDYKIPNFSPYFSPPLLANYGLIDLAKVTNLTEKSYNTFLGNQGFLNQILLFKVYLVFKNFIFLTEKFDEISINNMVLSRINEIPAEFLAGVYAFPKHLIVKLGVIFLALRILKSSSNPDEESNFQTKMGNLSLYNLVLKAPFLEELFFREFIQGSSISIMKVINQTSSYLINETLLANETISLSSRIFSAISFGLVHANQNRIQATASCICSFLFDTWLYERYGFFASLGLHFSNNLCSWALMRLSKKL